MKKKTMGRWMKDQKERKKQEIRAHNAQLHAAVSVAGVAAAVAALAATSLSSSSSPEKSVSKHKRHSKTSSAIASAAALVASHCLEIAEDMGADHDHILAVVSSAINARTNGDVMALTAGAADWPARETDGEEKMAYFAVQTSDRVIEFECRNKGDKELWVEGIQHMLHLHVI